MGLDHSLQGELPIFVVDLTRNRYESSAFKEKGM